MLGLNDEKNLGQTRHRAGQDCQGAPNVELDQYRRRMQYITLLVGWVGNVSEEFCREQRAESSSWSW